MLHLASIYGMHLFIICIMRSLRVPNIISWGPSTLVLCSISLSQSQSKSNWMIQAAGLAIIRLKLIFFAASMSDKYIWFMDSNKRRQYSTVQLFIHFIPFLCRATVLCVIKHFVWQCVFYSAGDCAVYLYDACNRQNKAFKNMCVSFKSIHIVQYAPQSVHFMPQELSTCSINAILGSGQCISMFAKFEAEETWKSTQTIFFETV